MPPVTDNALPPIDEITQMIAQYVCDQPISSPKAFETARLCLADALGCAILALKSKSCDHLLGPWVPGESCQNGARVVGSGTMLDPIKAAFDITALIRWQDYNDTWLAQEWGHPSDNLGALLSAMDFVSQRPQDFNNRHYTMQDLLDAMIRVYEIQGVLALSNSFNAVGLDHVVLVKLASTAMVTKILGGTKAQVQDAISQVWVDGQSLRTYRHAPNTGSRKSWAAADAASRAVRLALMILQGEPGYPSALTAERWGMQSVLLNNKPLTLSQPFGTYVMEHILFKISYPAEFHAQTAIECAVKLYPWLKDRLDEIKSIEILTQSPAMRIINKTGPLHSPADRDHALQYMVAIALIKGNITVQDYHPPMCDDPLITVLRDKMVVKEDPSYSKDYLDPKKRSIANRLVIVMQNGDKRAEEVLFPIGHPNRREDGIPLLWDKFKKNVSHYYAPTQVQALMHCLQFPEKLQALSVSEFMDLTITSG